MMKTMIVCIITRNRILMKINIIIIRIFQFLVPGRCVPAGLHILTSGAFLCSTEWLTNRHSAFDQMMIKTHRNLENIDENHENYDEMYAR